MLLSMAACGNKGGNTVNNPDNPDQIVENTTTLNIMILHVYSFINFLPCKVDIFIIFLCYTVNICSGLSTHLLISLPMIPL